jgi:hypothetical protein
LLEQVARISRSAMPNRISITGHTDAVNFEGPDRAMTNSWEAVSGKSSMLHAAVLAGQG